jgi:hypothetical protein
VYVNGSGPPAVTLLALERAYSPGVGNTCRIYELAPLSSAPDVRDCTMLNGVDHRVQAGHGDGCGTEATLKKRLICDLGQVVAEQGNHSRSPLTYLLRPPPP